MSDVAKEKSVYAELAALRAEDTAAPRWVPTSAWASPGGIPYLMSVMHPTDRAVTQKVTKAQYMRDLPAHLPEIAADAGQAEQSWSSFHDDVREIGPFAPRHQRQASTPPEMQEEIDEYGAIARHAESPADRQRRAMQDDLDIE